MSTKSRTTGKRSLDDVNEQEVAAAVPSQVQSYWSETGKYQKEYERMQTRLEQICKVADLNSMPSDERRLWWHSNIR